MTDNLINRVEVECGSDSEIYEMNRNIFRLISETMKKEREECFKNGEEIKTVATIAFSTIIDSDGKDKELVLSFSRDPGGETGDIIDSLMFFLRNSFDILIQLGLGNGARILEIENKVLQDSFLKNFTKLKDLYLSQNFTKNPNETEH